MPRSPPKSLGITSKSHVRIRVTQNIFLRSKNFCGMKVRYYTPDSSVTNQ
eukprot:TRINITY_DN387_c0_g1_i2.p2 TRINITY_DN387_c0_g1~~TRINITY_DN387_c0_g1_i2.p2  ORF type:complete len:50 (+),score=0.20 TRINITY_DN387_c0_g1_i2:271-420(+)